jgi:hypothetical protein
MADHVQHDPNAPARPTDGATVTRGAERDAVAAQHARYGGVKWGAAFFGWLTANGFAVILVALLSAAGVALGLANNVDTADEAANQAQTIGIGGGIAVLVVLFLAYLAGGYVAGRMSRFDGTRQGFAVWLIGLIVVLVLAVAGAILVVTLVGAVLGGKLGDRYHRKIDRAGFEVA